MKEVKKTTNFYKINNIAEEYSSNKEEQRLFKKVAELYMHKVMEVVFSAFPYKLPGRLGFLQLTKDRNKAVPESTKLFWERYDKADDKEKQQILERISEGEKKKILLWETEGYALSVRWFMGNPIDGLGPRPEWRYWFGCRLPQITFGQWVEYYKKNRKDLHRIPTKQLGTYTGDRGYISLTKHISQQIDL